MAELWRIVRGDAPLLIDVPHAGTLVGPDLARRLAPHAFALADTDWHVDRLYEFATGLGATLMVATHSRYVVDLNRPPDSAPLYPGQLNTGLIPTESFDGRPLYRAGEGLSAEEREARMIRYWRPYHAALQAELDRLRARHGRVILWDAHSIAATLPRIFDEPLPALNLGCNRGAACAPELQQALCAALEAQDTYDWICDGRFIGGHITRHYGRPEQGVHAVQMEIVRTAYMQDEAPFRYDAARAAPLQQTLHRLLQTALAFAKA